MTSVAKMESSRESTMAVLLELRKDSTLVASMELLMAALTDKLRAAPMADRLGTMMAAPKGN